MAMTKYRCSNDGCGVECTSKTNLAVYGTCHACGTGVMRRVREQRIDTSPRTCSGCGAPSRSDHYSSCVGSFD